MRSIEPLETRDLLSAIVGAPLSATASNLDIRMPAAITADSFAIAADASQNLFSSIAEHNGIASFLVENEPRMERYDIDNERWLSAVPLPNDLGPARILNVDDDGFYVAYDKSLYHFDSDGGNPRHVLDTPLTILSLHGEGDWLFVEYSEYYLGDLFRINLSSVSKSSNTVIDTLSRRYQRNSDVLYTDEGKFVLAEGAEYGSGNAYYPHYARPSSIWVFPNGSKAATQEGTIYALSNGQQLANLGISIRDISFVGDDIPIVLHGATLTTYTNTFVAKHDYTLPYVPDRIFINDRNVITFTVDSSLANGFRIGLVPLSDLDPPLSNGTVSPIGLSYTPDDVVLAADGTLLLHSKQYQSIFRWDPASQNYLSTISLMSTASHMAYSSETNTIYLSYDSGQIRQISLDSAEPIEVPFVTFPRRPQGLVAAGRYLFVVDPMFNEGSNYTLAPDGTLVDRVETDYRSEAYVWSEASQKVYAFSTYHDSFERVELISEEINASGNTNESEPPGGIGRRRTSTGAFALSRDQMWISPDGRVVLTGMGKAYDAESLQLLDGSIDTSPRDVAWASQGLYTISLLYGRTVVQNWDPVTYTLRESTILPGKSIALKSISDDRLLAVTLSSTGVPVFTLFNQDLEAIGIRDVTDQLEFYVYGRQYNRLTETYSFYVNVSNTLSPLTDLHLMLTDLMPDNIKVVNADGVDEKGVPYVEIHSRTGESSFVANQRFAPMAVVISVPPRQAYNFRPIVTGRTVSASGFQVLEKEKERTVSESGATTSFAVVLSSRPASNVVINVSSSDTSELEVDGALTFTPYNWNIPQSVIATGVDDSLVDGNQLTEVKFSVDRTVSDPAFESALDRYALVRTIDDEAEISFVQEYEHMAYFLVANNPRVERYSLADESWLSPIPLSDSYGRATLMHVNENGLFVVYERGIYRYGHDGSDETYLLRLEGVHDLNSDGNVLYINGSNDHDERIVSFNTTTNSVIKSNYLSSGPAYGTTFLTETNTLVGRGREADASTWVYYVFSDQGELITGYSFFEATSTGEARTWRFTEKPVVVNELGDLYGSWDGFATPIDDLAFLPGDVPIVLHGSILTAYTETIQPTRSYTLDYMPERIFLNGTHVITVSRDVSLSHGVRIDFVPISVLDPPLPGEPLDPQGVPIKPNQVEVAADGTLLLLSLAYQSIFRWDPQSRSYGDTIQLSGKVMLMTYSAATNTIYLVNEGSSQVIHKIDLSASEPAESVFVTLTGNFTYGISVAGEYLFVMHSVRYGAWVTTLAPDGSVISRAEISYRSSKPVWSDVNQKMYFISSGVDPVDLFWIEVNENGSNPSKLPGTVGSRKDSPLHDSAGFSNPVLVAPDGSVVVLGSGVVHDATTLARLDIALPNSFLDGTWLADSLFTIRDLAGAVEIQKWSQADLTLTRTIQLPGTANALKMLGGDRLLAITIDSNGMPVYTVLDANLDPVEVAAPIIAAPIIAEPIVRIADPGDQDVANGLAAYRAAIWRHPHVAIPATVYASENLALSIKRNESTKKPPVFLRLASEVDQVLSNLDDDLLREHRPDHVSGRLLRDLAFRLPLRRALSN